jgi:DNA-directed RNA polymerase specialized sigma24 family protein
LSISEEGGAMDGEGSVTCWIAKMTAGEQTAQQRLWQRYYHRLVRLAEARLRAAPRTVPADGEDVALDALNSVFLGAREGRFPLLSNRDDLWSLLVLITRRKAANLVRHENAQKRGGGKVRLASALPAAEEDGPLFGEVIGSEPDPAFAAAVSEQCVRLLAQLDDATLRDVAVWKMQGYTNREIAEKLGRAVSNVERKLAIIRKTWATEGRRRAGTRYLTREREERQSRRQRSPLMTACPPTDRLEALLEESLDFPAQQELEAHVGECAFCQAALKTLAQLPEWLRAQRAPKPRHSAVHHPSALPAEEEGRCSPP